MVVESFDAAVAEVAVAASGCFHYLTIGAEALGIVSYQKLEEEVWIIVERLDVARVGVG